jgi:hypothetical protein
LFHSVASEFYNRNGTPFCAHERTLADWVLLVEEIADQAFHTFLTEYPLVGEAVHAQQRERSRRDIRQLIAYDWETSHGRRFLYAERVFGRPIPVELPLTEHSLFVRGRIDRIDVEGLRTLVRDLKTGRATTVRLTLTSRLASHIIADSWVVFWLPRFETRLTSEL